MLLFYRYFFCIEPHHPRVDADIIGSFPEEGYEAVDASAESVADADCDGGLYDLPSFMCCLLAESLCGCTGASHGMRYGPPHMEALDPSPIASSTKSEIPTAHLETKCPTRLHTIKVLSRYRRVTKVFRKHHVCLRCLGSHLEEEALEGPPEFQTRAFAAITKPLQKRTFLRPARSTLAWRHPPFEVQRKAYCWSYSLYASQSPTLKDIK